MTWAGKAALITGGGTGVGRATGLGLAARGVNVAVNYSKSAAEAAQTVADLKAAGVDAIAIQADVASDAAVRAMVSQAAAAFGRLDFLVNSAGTTVFVEHADLEGMTEPDWDRILAVNLKGPYFTTRAVVPHMQAAGAGAVVNISSIAGLTGRGSSLAYAASKGALNTLTKSLARALAPVIRVNAVAPGIIDTRWVDSQREFLDAAVAKTPLQRAAQAEDVAATAIHLIESIHLTGHIAVVDGGAML